MSRNNAALSILGTLPQHVSGDARRVGDIVAALAPPVSVSARTNGIAKKEAKHESAGKAAMGLLPGAAGAAAGAYLFPDHWPLALLGGYAVGHSVSPLFKGGAERKDALAELLVTGAGIAGALLWDKAWYTQVAGFLGGSLLGGIGVGLAMPDSQIGQAGRKLLGK